MRAGRDRCADVLKPNPPEIARLHETQIDEHRKRRRIKRRRRPFRRGIGRDERVPIPQPFFTTPRYATSARCRAPCKCAKTRSAPSSEQHGIVRVHVIAHRPGLGSKRIAHDIRRPSHRPQPSYTPRPPYTPVYAPTTSRTRNRGRTPSPRADAQRSGLRSLQKEVFIMHYAGASASDVPETSKNGSRISIETIVRSRRSKPLFQSSDRITRSLTWKCVAAAAIAASSGCSVSM